MRSLSLDVIATLLMSTFSLHFNEASTREAQKLVKAALCAECVNHQEKRREGHPTRSVV